jgi:tetratricopeptide (TPR) repeat protein
MLARLRLTQRRWAEAEAAARRALELESDDEVAGSLLALALRMQGRAEETRQQAAGMLSENPESDIAHCNMGWSCLHDGRPAEAERHFLEALRLDPLYPDARAGLLEAFKSRSPFYRATQAWARWMARLGPRAEWLIAALVLALLFTRSAWGRSHPLLSALFYLGMVLLIVANNLTEALGHLVVLLDRRARQALTRAERWEASLLGALGLASVVYLIAGYALSRRSLVLGGGGLLALTAPLAHVFTNESPVGRKMFIGLTFAVAAGMLLVLYRAWLPWPGLDRIGLYLLAGGLIAALALAGNPRFNR